MKKAFLVLIVLLGAILVSCTDPDIEIPEEIEITGIQLTGASGQGTSSDPFVFSVEAEADVSASINVSPSGVVRNLTFTLVKLEGESFVPLGESDTPGLELNANNSNTQFSVKGLVPGQHYVKISQGNVEVFVRIDVTAPIEPEVPIDFEANLKVLAIGNSFSDDAMQYLYQIADDYGVENIVLGNLYIGGAELSLHASNAASDSKAYVYRKNTTGSWQSTSEKSILDGLLDEDWDIITIQQASGKSGRPEFYEPHLTDLIEYIQENKTNESARILWHMTWAYQANSTHGEFPFYNSNQNTMYEAIVSTYLSEVAPKLEVKGVIPAGTAIQNVRTSYVGDTVTHDGYHLNSGVGRLTAAMTYFRAITGLSIDDITYRPSGVTTEDLAMIKESVDNAVEKPFEVTLSTHIEDGGTGVNISNHHLLKLNWVLGYYVSTSAHRIYDDADNTKFFTTHDLRLSKENLPVGSVLRIETGYQYRINYFMSLDGETTDNMRTNNITTPEVVIDEAWWGNFEYVGFNISHVGASTDMTNTFKDASTKLSIYAAPGAEIPPFPHEDEPLSFVSGYWADNATQITNNGGSFDLGFAASNVLSKASLEDMASVTVAAGYQVRVIYLSYNGFGGYQVLHRTANQTGKIDLNEAFWGEYEYLAFNISTTPSSDLSSLLSELPDKLVFEEVANIPHVDEPLTFVSGYWFDNGTAVINAGGAFDLGFAASNVLSKESLINMSTVTIEAGYQVRVIFFSYDGNGGYRVLYRTPNTTGEIVMDDEFWGEYLYMGFNISTVPSSDLSGVLETLPEKIVFSDVPLVPHVDEPLAFVSGYWNNNATAVTNAGGSFDLGFAASNVISKEHLSEYTHVTIAAGYQVRFIFFSYDGRGGYRVLFRTENTTGTIRLNDNFWEEFEYLGFNISSTPSSNLSERLAELPDYITFATIEDAPEEELTFSLGYWTDGGVRLDKVSANHVQFIGSTVVSKDFIGVGTELVIETGYQVRIIFLTFRNNIPKVTVRTENFTGTVVLDETLWGDHQFIAFNISKVGNPDISAEVEETATKISFIKETE